MAFIPVTAKADIADGKKGRVTPEHSAVLNGFSLSKDSGILNILDRCEAVQQSHNATQATILFHSGYFVINGRLFEVEDGTTMTVSLPSSGTTKGYIVARVNLAYTGANELEVVAKNGFTIAQGDTYKYPSTAVYELPLYRYEASSSGVTLSRSDGELADTNIKIIEMTSTLIEMTSTLQEGMRADITANQGDIASIKEDIADIETRLTNLGFSTGSVTALSGATLRKYGKYAILQYPEQSVTFADRVFTIRLMGTPFVPKNTFTISVPAKAHQGQQISFTASAFTVTFTAGSREVTFRNDTLPTSGTGQHTLVLQANSIGFEIV